MIKDVEASAGALKNQSINAHTLWVLFMLGLGSMSYGYNASIIGTTLGQPSFISYMGLDTRSNGTDLLSTMSGIFQAGGVIGTMMLPTVADRYGRKWACAISCIILIVSGALMTGSVNPGMFIAFRFFSGAGTFMILAAVPILMNEIVPVHLRGAMVDIHAVLLVFGYTVQAWVGYGFFFWETGGSNTWRPPMALTMLFPLLMLLGLPFIPDSPRWLCMQNRFEEAEAILLKLHADPKDPNNEASKAEFYQIRKQIEIDRTLGSSWAHIWKKPSYRKRAFLAMGTTAAVQTSGVLVINNYGPTLYAQLGYSPAKQLLFPAAWLTMGVGVNALAMLLVDRFPRPQFLSFGVFSCAAVLAINAALLAEFQGSTNTAALQATVAMYFVFGVFYGLILDGTQFSYLGELFPTHIRAKGVCLGVATISLVNIVWLQAAPQAFLNIGWRFYLVFICTGVVAGTCLLIFFPDTKGKPLEEIAALFGDEDEVAVYQSEIDIDATTHNITDHHRDKHGTSTEVEQK